MNSIEIENHGITLGISKGANIGVTITSKSKMMNAQLDNDQALEIAEFLELSSQQAELLKRRVNALADRNNDLREFLKEIDASYQLILDASQKIIDKYNRGETIENNDFYSIMLALPQSVKIQRLIKKELE